MENENYMIEFKENEGTQVRINKIKDAVNWLCHEMQQGRVNNNNLSLKKDITSVTVPLSIAFVTLAEKGDIGEITASEHTEMFLPWNENISYNVGDLRTYSTETDTKLYLCLQAHTSQADWTPDTATSLWKVCGISENGIPEWSQPISTSDAYMTSDEVMDEGVHYRSLVDYNVWKPADYPQGWEVVE